MKTPNPNNPGQFDREKQGGQSGKGGQSGQSGRQGGGGQTNRTPPTFPRKDEDLDDSQGNRNDNPDR